MARDVVPFLRANSSPSDADQERPQVSIGIASDLPKEKENRENKANIKDSYSCGGGRRNEVERGFGGRISIGNELFATIAELRARPSEERMKQGDLEAQESEPVKTPGAVKIHSTMKAILGKRWNHQGRFHAANPEGWLRPEKSDEQANLYSGAPGLVRDSSEMSPGCSLRRPDFLLCTRPVEIWSKLTVRSDTAIHCKSLTRRRNIYAKHEFIQFSLAFQHRASSPSWYQIGGHISSKE
ncbi:hypothetical protein B0H16DRAFT_1480248 [Mycena metata]|uniref:Uncharacterized protein n=1 Tax=Mycena metata TaxID=1033252 RepID=A0AAD7MD53_9AGAR|nr:hypothetical protein B0H16DRAFT_1480248 [Mycena metata]